MSNPDLFQQTPQKLKKGYNLFILTCIIVVLIACVVCCLAILSKNDNLILGAILGATILVISVVLILNALVFKPSLKSVQQTLEKLNATVLEERESKEKLTALNDELTSKKAEVSQNIEELKSKNGTLLSMEEELKQNLEFITNIQQKLKESNKRYELAIQGSNDGLWDWDMVNNEVYFSPRWKAMVGYTETELENNFDTFSGLIHEEDKERVFQTLQNYLDGKTPEYSVEMRMKEKQGGYRWILARGAALRDKDGKPYRMSGSHVDIQQQKGQEQEIQQKNEQLIANQEELKQNLEELEIMQDSLRAQNTLIINRERKIQNFNGILADLTKRNFTELGDIQQVFKEITKALVEGLTISRASLWLLDKTEKQIVLTSVLDKNNPSAQTNHVFSEKEYPTYFEAISKNEMIKAENALIHHDTTELSQTYLSPLGVQTMLIIPILLRGVCVGVVACEHNMLKVWANEDCAFARSVADLVSIALESEERKKVEERLDLALKGSNDGLWDWDMVANTVYFSPRWKAMVGYAEAELENNFDIFSSLIHEEDKERVFQTLQNYLEGKTSEYAVEMRMKVKQGGYQWILARGAALRDKDGKPYRMSGSHVDIQQQKLQEQEIQQKNEELKASEEELKQNLEELQVTQEQMRIAQEEAERNAMNTRKVFEATPVGLLISKLDGTIINANSTLAGMLELPQYEIIGRKTVDFYANPEERAKVVEMLGAQGYFRDMELQLKNDEDKKTWVFCSGQIITLNGEKVLVAGFNDITEKKRIEQQIHLQNEQLLANEEELKQNLEELQATQENLRVQQQVLADKQRFLDTLNDVNPNTIIVVDRNYQVVLANQVIKQRYQESHQVEITVGMDVFLLLPPEAHGYYKNLYDRALNGELFREEVNFDDGVIKMNLLVDYFPIRNAKDEVIAAVAMASDVTNIRQTELVLKKNVEELNKIQEQVKAVNERFELAVQGANDGLWDWDITQGKMYLSPRWKSMLGYTEEELENSFNTYTKCIYEEDRDKTMAFLQDYLAGRVKEYAVEFRMCHKSGDLVWILARGTIVRNTNGQPQRMAGSHTNVTQRKEQEEQLATYAKNLEEMVEAQTSEIKKSFSQMIQSEKMAALGQLVAGVAHEINTPIGAIKASAENMAEALPFVVNELSQLNLTEEDSALFAQLTEVAIKVKPALTSREERQKRKEITQLLATCEVPNADTIASNLVQIGIIEDIEKYIPLFIHKNEVVLSVIHGIGRLRVNIDNIALATGKTKKIVSALKSYAYRQTDDMAMIDVVQSVDTILTLYHNQVKYGVEVVTNFEEVPLIEGYPDEIGQVWNNIIVNALQAMQYKGKLELNVLKQNNNICVSITDNGPGIPPEIQEKIFEPFFTTKPKGEGTGLGLDICKKIVEKHQGAIHLASQPGKTSFLIVLPIPQISLNN